MSNDVTSPMTRRQLLGSAAAAGLVLAGCGSSGSGKPGSTTTAAGAGGPRKRGGTFRYGTIDSITSLDPNSISTAYEVATAMFDPLLRMDHNYKPQMWLAEEFTVEKDLRAWTVRLRSGVEFHNGKTLTADDVIYTMQRWSKAGTEGYMGTLIKTVDVKNLKKLDARTVRIPLTRPNSGLSVAFTYVTGGIVPVGFDPKKPVGTGPFKYQSFTPTQRWAGTRNPNYWRHGQPYLDELQMQTFASSGVAELNALLSGQADGMSKLVTDQLSQVQGRSELTAIISPTGANQQIDMRSATPNAQFKDPRVREAFKLMVDRRQLVNEIYAGHGGLGNDVGAFAQWDPAVDPSLPQREQDLDKARSLLKAAGMEGMTATFMVGNIAPGQTQTAELVQNYAKQIGVDLKLNVVSDLATFYGPANLKAQMVNDSEFTITLYAIMGYDLLSTAVYNTGLWDNAQADKLYYEAIASPPGEKYNAKMHELSRVIWEDGPWIVWGRQDEINAYSNKFTGIQHDATGTGINGYHWEEIGLA